MPVLSMTPESRALTGDGAMEWASGSQSWPRGKTPALRPKPEKEQAEEAEERHARRSRRAWPPIAGSESPNA